VIPGVSVIIPTYNRNSVFAAIASVLAQRGVEFELIVVDDGSTDDTWRELERCAAQARDIIRIVRTSNRGVAAARNKGIAMAAAPLVAFLDSDDTWAPRKLARQTEFMSLNPRCVIAQTEEVWIRDGRRVNPGRRHRKRAGDIFVDSLRTCLISPSAAIVRTDCLCKIEGFDEDLMAAEDYDLWLRILVDHEAGLIEEPLVTRHAGHPGQLSMTVRAIDRYRILALLRLLGGDALGAQSALDVPHGPAVRNILDEAKRHAVCDALAEKCAIYADGLARRGRSEDADFVRGLSERAQGLWRDGAIEGLVDATAAMRRHVKGQCERWTDLLPSGTEPGQ
jgi:glycosyltransferase involved in cell wall biosynthesis